MSCSFRPPAQQVGMTARYRVMNGLADCSNTTSERPYEFFDHTEKETQTLGLFPAPWKTLLSVFSVFGLLKRLKGVKNEDNRETGFRSLIFLAKGKSTSSSASPIFSGDLLLSITYLSG